MTIDISQYLLFDAGTTGPTATVGTPGPDVDQDAAPDGHMPPHHNGGHVGPRRVQQHPWQRHGGPVVAFDWSIRKGVEWTINGIDTNQCPDVGDVIINLADLNKIGARVVCESSVSSYPKGQRNVTIQAFADAGHQLFFIAPKLTGRYRGRPSKEGTLPREPDPSDRFGRNNEPPDKKSDELDAQAIYAIATSGRTIPYVAKRDDNPAARSKHERRDAARYLFWEAQKDGNLPRCANEARRLLGLVNHPTTLQDSTLTAIYFAMMHTTSRKGLEALIGMSGGGYPSIMRAYVHTNEGRVRAGNLSAWRLEMRNARSALLDAGHGYGSPMPTPAAEPQRLDL